MNGDDRLIFLLATAQQAVKKHANKTLAAEGVRITIAQSGVLFLLKRRDRRMISEIGKILGIENSAMTGLVDRLEKSGFVIRVTDPADRRASLISATHAGLDEAAKAKPVIRRINATIKTGFSENEIEVFRSVLGSIMRTFGRI